MDTTARQITVKVDPAKKFTCTLSAEQIVLAIDVLRNAMFKGEQVELASSLIDAIQSPVLLDAHGATPQ